MAKNIPLKLTPHIYKGEECNLGRHGTVRKGDVILLTPRESLYVSDDENFAVTDKQPKEPKNPAPADIQAEVVSQERMDEAVSAEESNAVDDETLEEFRKDLKKNYPKKEDLFDYCEQHDIELKGNPTKDEIVDAIIAYVFKD